jgi:transcriptional regulator with XRE-family HTH domain
MDELLTPRDIELLAKSKGLTLVDVCKQAGIAESTFFRWKKGVSEPTLDVYRRLRDVVMAVPGSDKAA